MLRQRSKTKVGSQTAIQSKKKIEQLPELQNKPIAQFLSDIRRMPTASKRVESEARGKSELRRTKVRLKEANDEATKEAALFQAVGDHCPSVMRNTRENLLAN